ncbi:hypothetical protein PT974_04965 [Cladobotryum mycophilum]|uniref:Uncharacterized protein n=1 Tax=Cladobotryum mycophilum TaxID=491253 RepID=A0ABR0SQV7_9HYPO
MEARPGSSQTLFSPARRRGGITKSSIRKPAPTPSSYASASTSVSTSPPRLPSATTSNQLNASSARQPPPLLQRPTLPRVNDARLNDASPSLGEAVLGLDVGMTATRASFVSLDWKGRTDVAPVIVSPEIPGEDASNSCDFPSLALPFRLGEPPEACLAYATNTHDLTLPLKMYCYFIRACQHYEDGDEKTLRAIRRRIPQLDTFWRHYEQCNEIQQTSITSHLQKIFKAHLKMVKDTSDLRASNKGLRITRLAITIPPNWDHWLEEMYIYPEGMVYESEAVGHWFLRLDTYKRERERIERFILGDFGGHTMNTCSFQIVRPNDENKFSFFAVREATCEHGGSELHATWVRDQVSKEVKKRHPYLSDEDSTTLVKNCMTYYRRYQRKSIDGKPFKVSGTIEDPEAESRPPAKRGVKRKRRGGGGDDRTKLEKIYILEHYATKFYEDAFKKPLGSLRREINRSSRETKNSAVMLSGGSFLNSHVRETAERLIHKAGLTFEDWVAKNGQAGFRSSIVSIGAALAVANSMTVQEFMQNALFAIDTGSKNMNLLVTLNSGRSQWVELDYTGKQPKQLLIACAPLAPSTTSSCVLRLKTYEFWNLGGGGDGDGDDDDGHHDWLVFEHARLVQGKPDEAAPPIRWPIYYDPGACVCFIDHDKNKVNDQAQRKANKWLHQRAAPTLERLQNFQRDPGSNLWEDRISRETATAATTNDGSTQDQGNSVGDNEADVPTTDDNSSQTAVDTETHEAQVVQAVQDTVSEAAPSDSSNPPQNNNRGLAPIADMSAHPPHETQTQAHQHAHINSRFTPIIETALTPNSLPPFSEISSTVPQLAASFNRFDGISSHWFDTPGDHTAPVGVSTWATPQQYVG